MWEVWVTFYMRVKPVITSFSKGYYQVFIKDNVVSVLFFFLANGLACVNMRHPEILYFSALSAALYPFFAWYLRYPDEEINDGIWGYNAVLYGIACCMLVLVSVSGIAVLMFGTLEILLLIGFRYYLTCCLYLSWFGLVYHFSFDVELFHKTPVV
ncbi:hypothetical protein FJD13_25640, partial [Escherichia coli]|uniref:urea transporter n=1 Tax=Escherichia coli TaxID=562 RepID=UPI001C6FF20F